MTEEDNNLVLRLLREIRQEISDSSHGIRDEIRSLNNKFEGLSNQVKVMDSKLSKLTINLAGVRGRLTKVENQTDVLAEVVHSEITNKEAGI